MSKPTVVVLDRIGIDEYRLADGRAILDTQQFNVLVLSMTGVSANNNPSLYTAQHFLDLFCEQTVQTLLDQIESTYGIDFIVTLDEEHQLQAAALREQYGCYGRSANTLAPFRNKVLMKTVLQNQVTVPKFEKLTGYGDAIAFLNRHGKSVIKPIQGLGSERTYVIHNAIDLRLQLGDNPLTWADYEIEQFIAGDMVHVDAVMLNGQIAVHRVSRYLSSTLDYAAGEPLMAVQVSSQTPLHTNATQLLATVADVMEIDNAVVHMEAFVLENQQLVFCEIGLRPGGGGVRSQFLAATGVDLFHVFLRLEVQQPVTVPKAISSQLAGYILYPPRSGTVASVSDLADFGDEWIVHKRVFTDQGDKLNSNSCCLGKTALFTVVGEADAVVTERINNIRNRFRIELTSGCCA